MALCLDLRLVLVFIRPISVFNSQCTTTAAKSVRPLQASTPTLSLSGQKAGSTRPS